LIPLLLPPLLLQPHAPTRLPPHHPPSTHLFLPIFPSTPSPWAHHHVLKHRQRSVRLVAALHAGNHGVVADGVRLHALRRGGRASRVARNGLWEEEWRLNVAPHALQVKEDEGEERGGTFIRGRENTAHAQKHVPVLLPTGHSAHHQAPSSLPAQNPSNPSKKSRQSNQTHTERCTTASTSPPAPSSTPRPPPPAASRPCARSRR